VIAEGGENWRKAFGRDEVTQRVRFTESRADLRNPHKGTTTFQRFSGDPLYPGERWSDAVAPLLFKPFTGDPAALVNRSYPSTTVAYCRWVWRVIEPEPDKYRWDVIDGALKAARQRGQTLQVRLQPGAGGAGVPEWLFRAGAARWRRNRRYADANSPQYIEHWTDLIRDFAKRYDGHPDLESFDVAYAGPCGETGGNATPRSARLLVDAYLDGFRKTRLVGMLGTEGCRYAMGRRKDIGWRVDCFGDTRGSGGRGTPPGLGWNHMLEAYPKSIVSGGARDRWKTAPVVLETCWTVGAWKKQGRDLDFILDWGLRQHASVFMPKSCAIPAEWRKRIDAFNRKLGYRFVLRQVRLPMEGRPGRRRAVTVYLDNVGVAPIYRPYRLALRFKQKDVVVVVPFEQDIRTWLPGLVWFRERLRIPAALRPGVAKVDMAIVDPKTHTPVVRFAVTEALPDGWVPLRYLDILAPGEPSKINPRSPYMRELREENPEP